MIPDPLALAKEALTRLDEMLPQLRRMEAATAFGGAGTSVRVKDAPFLIETLEIAREALAALDAGGGEDALTQRLIAALRHGGLGKVTVDAEQPGDAELRGYFDLEKAARYLTLPPPPRGERG